MESKRQHDPPRASPTVVLAPGRRRRLLYNYALLTVVSLALTLYTLYRSTSTLSDTPSRTASNSDPADEWHDDVWPLRESAPWDISTDYPHPRKLEYEVSEGTWMRLDVNPASHDIVFDMLGDVYCIPADEISPFATSRARAVLQGVPHDSDPHFSPEGDRLVFRSDAGLGVENIWVMEWKGCREMEVVDPGFRDDDELLLAQGVKETEERRSRRLLREGRAGAQRVTNETYRFVSDARFHQSGTKVVATKWYTSSRSLGAGEGWEYPVPSLEDLRSGVQREIAVASGTRVLSRTLPLGWTPEQYGDQQIGPEQIIWSGEDSLIYAKNVKDTSSFEYSKDVHRGIYAIFQTNLTSKETETLVESYTGGASRPELSRDGRTLAFVRRVRDKEALVLKDLVTGTIHNVWYGLTYDLSTVSAPMGTYPSFSFTPGGEAVIIWAAGQIYYIPLSMNNRGERIASTHEAPYPIKFRARIEKRLAETVRGGVDLKYHETQDTQRVTAFKELSVDDRGDRVVFQAAGVTYFHSMYERDVIKVPTLRPDLPYYSPSFIHNAPSLVIHARWSDINYTTLELADIDANVAYELEGLSLGRYFAPVLSGCEGQARSIAFVKSAGDYLSGNIIATAKPGLYIGKLTLPDPDVPSTSIAVSDVTFVPSQLSADDRVTLRFLEGNKKLLVQQSATAFIIDLSAPDFPHTPVADGEMSSEISVSLKPGKDGVGLVPEYVAFVDFMHVYLAPGNSVRNGQSLWSKPAKAAKGLARLSLDGGHDLAWSRDGKKLFWFLGPYLHSLEINKLNRCSTSIKQDRVNFGIQCVKDLLYYQEVIVEHSTDIAKLKKEAGGNGMLIVYNATLVTMATRKEETDLVRNGILIVKGGVIEAVATLGTFDVPHGAMVIDAKGGYVVPGFIDVHAHWDGYDTVLPAKSWEMQTFLAYGVTTLHNPSASNALAPIERSKIESGFMVGPRIFTTGDVVYGAAAPPYHQDVVDLQDAQSILIRIKAEAGPFGISYKNYNLPSRAARQRLLAVARNFSMSCVPEGGMEYDWDLTYIIDGMTTIEHAIPVPVLYDDVRTLYALSGTGSTPTHVVNYGGAWGEQYVWAHEDIPNDPKLRRFSRHDILEGLSESTARPDNSYSLFNTSASVAKMVHSGLLAHIGAHGEPPLGLNYHAEMEFTKAGGLSRYETLRAATIDGAKTLGLDSSIGSLETGKLADFLIYPPGVELLEGGDADKPFSTVGPTRDILMVVRGGRIWNAETMEEVWPVAGRKQVMPIVNTD